MIFLSEKSFVNLRHNNNNKNLIKVKIKASWDKKKHTF